MEIKPTTSDWIFYKNWMHFYILIAMIPASIITTIINIRANPQLSEVPDGYEPRYWEYFKHPISRWMARYLYDPVEQDHEIMMAFQEGASESKVLSQIIAKVDKVMSFYQDHRSMYFRPKFADYYRIGREESLYLIPLHHSESSYRIDQAYDPDIAAVPVEGYPDGPLD